MQLQTTSIALMLSSLLLVGCGSGSSSSSDTTTIDLPNGLTMIFFDNESSAQYLYDTESEKYENMNSDSTQNYDMSGKHGKPIVWFHESAADVDQKVVMLNDTFNITNGNLTHNDFHYLGHFHEDNNEKYFAAHSPDEFDLDNNASAAKLATLSALNNHLLEQEEIKTEIAQALPSGESLCNYYVLGEHEDHDEANATHEESVAHIALSSTGMVYIFNEQNGALASTQSPFALEGVSACESDESAIVKVDDDGVMIFSAQSQKLYLVDNHGMDFHQHSSWDISKFLPTEFTPTTMISIVEEGEAHHDH